MTKTGEAPKVEATTAAAKADMFEARRSTAASDVDGAHPQIVRATDLTGVHVLKHENLFMLSSAHGDIRPDGRGLGLYDSDTRVLSTYEMLLNGVRPVVLRAGPAASFQSTIQLTNPDLFADPLREFDGSEIVLRRQSLGVVRERVIANGFRERITITNYTTGPERARVTLAIDADYADIFELRGAVRAKRGERLVNVVGDGSVAFAYRGLDGVLRRTHVALSPPMSVLSGGERDANGVVMLELDETIDAGGALTLTVEVWHEDGAAKHNVADSAPPRIDPDQAIAMHRAWRQSSAAIDTSHVLAERALERASADLRLLLNTDVQSGERYIAAGVPWFSCLFGRDSIITGLQLLSVRPQIARNTLTLLARYQATRGRRLARRPAGQDPARAAHRRAGAHQRDPAHAVLRHGRCHAAVADAARRIRALDGRRRAHRPALAQRARGARRGSTTTAIWTMTASSSTSASRSAASPTRAGRTRGTRSATATAASPTARSRWSRSRATSTRRGAASRAWPGCAASAIWR